MRLALIAPALLALFAAPVQARPVLLISIDGLRPGDVIDADKRGLKIPNLRRFLIEGSFASGVRGVLPTVTYPSHATLLTGAAPARHGIVNNLTFDPTNINQSGWYWFAPDIRVPTLWDAAHAKGLVTANVHWPSSVEARAIDWNLPQIWRTGHGDDDKLFHALATPGLIEALATKRGSYPPGIAEDLGSDEKRAGYAVQLIADHKPDFITVYLTALDHNQHQFGPDTPEAHAVLERLDVAVGTLVAAEQSAHPDATIAVVSDHGFAATSTEVNLWRAFIDAGFVRLDAEGKIAGWDAVPWNSGGSSAIVLARPADTALVAKVRALLNALQANPATHIDTIADAPAIATMGGNPQAAFYVDFAPGAMAGAFKGAAAPLIGPSGSKGMHGHFPSHPEMRSTFLIMGPTIIKGRNVGEIDMRAIAPTLARILGVTLAGAERDPAL